MAAPPARVKTLRAFVMTLCLLGLRTQDTARMQSTGETVRNRCHAKVTPVNQAISNPADRTVRHPDENLWRNDSRSEIYSPMSLILKD